MKYDLRVIYGERKSFYGKATITEENGLKTLRSYQTDVCFIKEDKAYIKGFHSNTTTRHIKEFLKQNGFKAENTKQMLKDYSKEIEIEEEKKENPLKMVGFIASLGEVFGGKTKKDKNDWKMRMLKAGLENKGLSVPSDWNTLTEEEKERRLNGVIKITRE